MAAAHIAVPRLVARDAVRAAEITPPIVHGQGAGVTVADAWIVRARHASLGPWTPKP